MSSLPLFAHVLAGDVLDPDGFPATLAAVDDGVVSLGEGRDDEPIEVDGIDRSIADIFPWLFSHQDGLVLSTTSTALATAWLAGDGRTLAHDELLRGAAGVLDSADAITAHLFRAEGGERDVADRTPVDGQPPLNRPLPAPTPVVAIGLSFDIDGPVLTVVHVFGDEAVAEDMIPIVDDVYRNGSLILAPGVRVADIVTLESLARVDGMLVATTRPTGEVDPRSLVARVDAADLRFATSTEG